MAWVTRKVEFKPGVIADSSELASEGGYVSANNVRWRRGYAQTIGGWEKLTPSTFTGIVRGGKAWADLDGNALLAFGTQSKFYGYVGTSLLDITPKLVQARLGPNPLASVAGSKTITVTFPGHGFTVGNTFQILRAATSGFEQFTVSAVLSPSKFQYQHHVAATLTEDFGSRDGVNPYIVANLPAGPVDAAPGVAPRVWSVDNYGEMIVALPSAGKLYAGFVESSYPELIIKGDFTGVTDEWAVSNSTSWKFDANSARISLSELGSASGNLSQNIRGRVLGGRHYVLAFDFDAATTVGSDSLELKAAINAGDPAAEVVILDTITGKVSYPRIIVPFVCPANPVDLVIYGKFTRGGASGETRYMEVDNVSITEVPISPIDQAPGYSNAMFVDPNRIVVLLGTIEADGDYNPMLVRWSAQENMREWIPDADNLAGEYPLAKGGRIVGGLPTRQQSLIWTDESLYSMQFTGSAADPFSFRLMGSSGGLIARHAAAEQNGIAFWMSNDGNFYIFQGAIPQTIDCPLRDYVFDNLNKAQQAKIYAGINPAFNEVWWFYPRGANTECSHYVSYNWVEQQWSHGEMARTTWLPNGIFANPIAFGTNGYIYKQEFGNKADGATMSWSLETGYTDIEDGDRLLAVREYRCDHAYQAGDIKISFLFKNDALGNEFTEGPHVVPPEKKRVLFRRMARQMKIRWENGTDSEGWRDGVKNIVVQQTGARR